MAAPDHAPLELIMYSRPGCHLCDEAWTLLESRAAELGYRPLKVDIDADPELLARYGHDIPVGLLAGARFFKHRLDPERLAAACRARRAQAAAERED